MAKQMLHLSNANAQTAYEKHILSLCKKLGFRVQFCDDVVCINSGFSRWLLVMEDQNTVKEALHENHRFNILGSTQGRKTKNGFHTQKLYSKELPEVLKYIKYHDKANLKQQRNIFDVLQAG